MKTETIIRTDYSELEALIKKTYEAEYNIVAYEEAKNYSSINKTVVKEFDICDDDEYDLEAMTLFKKGKPMHYTLNSILNDMCRLEVIEAGNYVIDIFW